MQLGRFFGLLAMLLGGFATAFLYTTIHEDGTYIKGMLAGPVFFMIGVAMLFFPGGDITINESKQKIKEPDTVFKQAPGKHKMIWAVAGVIGFVVAMIWTQ